MDEDILTYIEERPVFCTYCGDYKFLDNTTQSPCPLCNKEVYDDWKKNYKYKDNQTKPVKRRK